MGQNISKINTKTVLGFGFIIDSNYDIDICEYVMDYINKYNSIYGTNFNYYINKYPDINNQNPDKIFISLDKIVSYNQNIIVGNDILSSKDLLLEFNKFDQAHLNNILQHFVSKQISCLDKIGWKLFEIII